MDDIEFGEVTVISERFGGGEDIETIVYADGKESSIKKEIKVTEACVNKDEVLKELLAAAGLVDQFGDVSIIIKRGKVGKPYLVTRQWRTSYKRYV